MDFLDNITQRIKEAKIVSENARHQRNMKAIGELSYRSVFEALNNGTIDIFSKYPDLSLEFSKYLLEEFSENEFEILKDENNEFINMTKDEYIETLSNLKNRDLKSVCFEEYSDLLYLKINLHPNEFKIISLSLEMYF